MALKKLEVLGYKAWAATVLYGNVVNTICVMNFISFLLYNTSRARDTHALPRFSYLASL